MNYFDNFTIILNNKTNSRFSNLKTVFTIIFLLVLIIHLSSSFNIVNCMEPEADEIVVDTINSVDRAGLPLILGITIVVSIIIWIFGIK
jgi:hypothetical protein